MVKACESFGGMIQYARRLRFGRPLRDKDHVIRELVMRLGERAWRSPSEPGDVKSVRWQFFGAGF